MRAVGDENNSELWAVAGCGIGDARILVLQC